MSRLLQAAVASALLLVVSACSGGGAAAGGSACFWRLQASGDVQLDQEREGRGFPGAYGFYEDDGELVLTLSTLSQASLVGFWLDMHVESAPAAGETGTYPLSMVIFRTMEGVNPADARYRLADGATGAELKVLERSDDWLAAEFKARLQLEDGEAATQVELEGAFRTPLGKTRCPD